MSTEAQRIADRLVENFHENHGEAVEEAARAGELAKRFEREVAGLRESLAGLIDPAVLAGKDPVGEALRRLAGRFGISDQISLAPRAASAPPRGDGAGGDAALVTRLRGALVDARTRLARLEKENLALREELHSAGEMIETLALDLEKPE